VATINSPYLAHTAGFPSQSSDTINDVLEGLIVGETPAVVTQDLALAASQTLAAYTPVGFNSSGFLVPALRGSVAPEDDIQAIGITLYPIVVAGGQNPGVPILRAGCLAKHMINWPASFTTDAHKFAAFAGAPTPTNIVVREVYYGSVVAAP